MATPWVVALVGLLQATLAGSSTFERGLEYYRRGELLEAERAVREMLTLQPEHAPSAICLARLNELGSLLLDGGRPREAEAAFGLASAEHPDNLRALTGLVQSRLALGRSEKALEEVTQALGRRPNQAGLHWLEATVEANRGRYEEAPVSMERALAMVASAIGIAGGDRTYAGIRSHGPQP